MGGSTKTFRRVLAVLKLPEDKVPQLVTYADSVVRKMAGSPLFPSPRPALTVLEAAVAALSQAEVATRSRTSGTVATRDEKRVALVLLLQELRSYVQAIADADPENAVSIIERAGMAVKKGREDPPRVFAAKRGPVSGSVKLIAPRAGERASYEWAQSSDAGQTWVSLPVTVKASTRVLDLPPASTVHFRYRVANKDGTGDWSQTVSIIVD